MWACEVAGLLISDVLQVDETAKTEIILKASQTNGSKSRIVYVSKRLQKRNFSLHSDNQSGRL